MILYVLFKSLAFFPSCITLFYSEISESGCDIKEPLGKKRDLFLVLKYK